LSDALAFMLRIMTPANRPGREVGEELALLHRVIESVVRVRSSGLQEVWHRRFAGLVEDRAGDRLVERADVKA
jgi:hypothetical protein